jgi:cytochrome c biogenesis protein CcdA/thiol-disulfide isomerase/thioredoxin
MLAGMSATFAAVATLAGFGGSWAVHANEVGRWAAIALLAMFGVMLISTRAAAILTRPIVALGGRISGTAGADKPSAGGSLLLGMATGLLWAPCAGPILGLVLTGAALHGANPQTSLLLATYAAGAATSLALAVMAGGKVFAAMKRSLRIGHRIRQGLGGAVLAGVTVIALGLDTGLLTRLSYASTTGIEQALLDRVHDSSETASTSSVGPGMQLATNDARQVYRSRLPVEGTFPSLDGAVKWLNSEPLTAEQLRGKVVLINFWTYSCINCIRTVPYVRAWAEKYKDQGLVVIGVHSPEFAFEKRIHNVERATQNFEINYPVAVDNNFRIWRAFRNNYWPAYYFIDAEGGVRHHHFGEGDYEGSERVIQELLAEAGSRKADNGLVTPNAQGAEAPPDLARIRSGETYVGYMKASNFRSRERVSADEAQDYTTGQLRLNEWSLAGNWTVGAEQAALNRAGGSISYKFRARDLHLVLGAGRDGKPVRFQVTIDGAPPGAANQGADVDADGNGTVSETRLYQLVRQSGDVRERTFEIRFLDPGVEAFVFTFG